MKTTHKSPQLQFDDKNIRRKQWRRYGIFLYILGICISCLTACKKLVEIPPPSSQLVTASVFNNNNSATAAVTNIYAEMYSKAESLFIARDNGFLADELVNYNLTVPNPQYYKNAMVASVEYYGQWIDAYNYIYQANAVLSGLQQYSGVSAAVKQQLMGEAYFIRGFWHFYLTNCYGAVPLALTTDYTVTSRLSRTPRVQVLQQVISDLQLAKTMLNNNYVDATDTATTNQRVRPIKAAALALLARAYLYLGDYNNQNLSDYSKADSASTAVINNSTFSLCTNLSGANSVFLANSSEAIWQIATPLPASYNTMDGNGFILIAAPGGIAFTSISSELLNAFEPGDQRAVNWIGSITQGTATYYFPYKYKIQSGGSTITEYTMVLRLAEQYLIRAEAEAHLNQLGSAAADLNIIRNRAGLPNTTANTQTGLLTAILHERQVELFTEWGHRWFDLNRTGNTTAVMSVVTPSKGGTWNANGYQELYPIAETELIRDNNLTQNPGY